MVLTLHILILVISMVDSPRFMATLRIFCKYVLNGDGPTKFIDLVIRRSGVVRRVKELNKPCSEPCWLCGAVTV